MKKNSKRQTGTTASLAFEYLHLHTTGKAPPVEDYIEKCRGEKAKEEFVSIVGLGKLLNRLL